MLKGVIFLFLFFRSSNTSKRSEFSTGVHLRCKIISSSLPIPFRATVTNIVTSSGRPFSLIFVQGKSLASMCY